jgi:hypothetical protein
MSAETWSRALLDALLAAESIELTSPDAKESVRTVIAHVLEGVDASDVAALPDVAARLLDELVDDEDVEEVFGDADDLAKVLRETAA